jgi:hypothetical protein
MDRDEMVKQLDRWTEIFRREAIILFDKGVGPGQLMATAITITDALLAAEVAASRARKLEIAGDVIRRRPS